MTISTSGFDNFKSLGQNINSGIKLFKKASTVINTVSKHPLTKLAGDRIPQLQPLIQKVNVGNERIQRIGNSLEKAEKKIKEVESAISFH